ncbi:MULTISPECIES: hypothetical protein [unclassified Paraburkholderia]|uniref:hypothetical protein n=1 Tax=unclassified Paraburkholderia TaxID=2615204 RepID=UPI00181E56AC|nr:MULTISPECIES: hypothetical protein [unclassified Paraburkholderia]MBB5447102.1 hypothetical protein [Paraburkholderia sp. WSM4177]MBB5487643.1 hypothetical protein [Paraburkholderia sp. WSM4180]
MAATGTALALSVLSGWQRGGTSAERGNWIALGAVLVVSAHLLPALVRGASGPVRAVAFALWIACLASAGYGHAGFFLLAQQHAGELRARSMVVDSPAVARTLPAVMMERVAVVRQLGEAQAQRCTGRCAALEARRATLAAQRDALDAEADELRRDQGAADMAAARSNARRADPVTSRLSGLLAAPVARVDLLTGLMLAAVLEGVACLLWTIALLPVTRPVVTRVATSRAKAADRRKSGEATPPAIRTAARAPVTPRPAARDVDETARLARDVKAGHVRPTVADIRRHLRCSQARATALRRKVVDLVPA